jgi:fused signal recognition particle receptor
MEPIVLIGLLVLIVLATVGGVVLTRRRARPELEPPAPPPPLQPEAPASIDEQAVPEAEILPEAEAPPEAERPPAPPSALQATPVEEAPIEEMPVVEPEAPPAPAEPVAPPRFRDRLAKARGAIAGALGSIRGRTAIDEETWEDLEEALIRADVGIGLTTSLLDQLRAQVRDEDITSPDALLEALKADLKARLVSDDRALRLGDRPAVWLFVGVNGVGKTTTIGKVGLRQAGLGRQVVMAAGDTFRAAAGEQLATWAERVGADVVRGVEGGDPASVVFDAVERAAARGADLVLADTAGRLHTKVNLMEELKKVRRVAERPPGHLSEVLLVIDATTGQNGLVQAKEFASAVDVTGIVLTKLDSSAKGGIALAIQTELGIPIKLVGLGESAEDLVDFDPDEYVEGLLA